MGGDASAVVDEIARPRIAILRVADPHLPSITSGNTNSPTIMIAEKASHMILADAKNPAFP